MEINNTQKLCFRHWQKAKDLIFREQKPSPQMFIVYCTEPLLICVFFSKSNLVCVHLIPGIRTNQKISLTGKYQYRFERGQETSGSRCPYGLIWQAAGTGGREDGGSAPGGPAPPNLRRA